MFGYPKAPCSSRLIPQPEGPIRREPDTAFRLIKVTTKGPSIGSHVALVSGYSQDGKRQRDRVSFTATMTKADSGVVGVLENFIASNSTRLGMNMVIVLESGGITRRHIYQVRINQKLTRVRNAVGG